MNKELSVIDCSISVLIDFVMNFFYFFFSQVLQNIIYIYFFNIVFSKFSNTLYCFIILRLVYIKFFFKFLKSFHQFFDVDMARVVFIDRLESFLNLLYFFLLKELRKDLNEFIMEWMNLFTAMQLHQDVFMDWVFYFCACLT